MGRVVFSLSSFSWCRPFRCRLFDAVEVALQSVYVSGPEAAELREPVIHLLKWFRFQPVETPLRVHGSFHETGLAQHPQVL